jgi:hypothetical protein
MVCCHQLSYRHTTSSKEVKPSIKTLDCNSHGLTIGRLFSFVFNPVLALPCMFRAHNSALVDGVFLSSHLLPILRSTMPIPGYNPRNSKCIDPDKAYKYLPPHVWDQLHKDIKKWGGLRVDFPFKQMCDANPSFFGLPHSARRLQVGNTVTFLKKKLLIYTGAPPNHEF